MKPLLLLGGGGHCHSAIDVIESEAQYRIVGVVQPPVDGSEPVLGYPIVGSDDDLPALLTETPRALITVGHIKSPATRVRLFDLLKGHGVELPVVRSPRAYCSRRSIIGEGSILMHDSLINATARIGANCIVNSQALIEHDVGVGDHCHISTGARVNGGALIGTGCFIGSGAVLKEGIEIGDGAIIGAGQVVLRDVEPGKIVRSHCG
jgi:sugar O-acyltransferase (sialic acid O-acetyltransferase NeuD family)